MLLALDFVEKALVPHLSGGKLALPDKPSIAVPALPEPQRRSTPTIRVFNPRLAPCCAETTYRAMSASELKPS